jgi:hypothetical protein
MAGFTNNAKNMSFSQMIKTAGLSKGGSRERSERTQNNAISSNKNKIVRLNKQVNNNTGVLNKIMSNKVQNDRKRMANRTVTAGIRA